MDPFPPFDPDGGALPDDAGPPVRLTPEGAGLYVALVLDVNDPTRRAGRDRRFFDVVRRSVEATADYLAARRARDTRRAPRRTCTPRRAPRAGRARRRVRAHRAGATRDGPDEPGEPDPPLDGRPA